MSEKTAAPTHVRADDPLADDILRGAPAIAEFIGETENRTYYLARQGLLPIGRQGQSLIGSKRRLRAHYALLTGGQAA